MAGKTKMKCHYEVLGVERDAGADDLKKSYRKLALKWHPDKNPDNVEECTSQFRLVQQAYDVLSDPQERAWYDKHREAILKGGLGHGDNYEDDSMDVFQYFNSSCYSGFNDDENGFYCVYQDVFTKLSEEDYHFMDDRESECDFPEFGNSKSSYEEVVKPFYDFWESYQTAKSYVWVEKYDTREAPDRRCRRLMEAENKKLRDAAKKERNEQIRALVKFIKKRDKRVQAYKKLLEERNEEIKKKAKENRERQIQERLKKMENYKETDWSAMTELEDDLQKLEKSLSHQFGETHPEDEAGEGRDQDGEEDKEEEEYYDDFFCVACNKAFKSDKAFSNHERSKKHKENLAFLRQQMHEEDGELADMLDGLDLGGGPDTEPKEEEEDTKQKLSKKQKKKRKQQKRATIDDEDDEDEDELSKAANGFVCEEETAPPTPDTRKEKEKKKWKKKGNEAKDKNTKTEATETNESLSTVGNGTTDNIDTVADIAGATSSNADVDREPEQETVENGEQQSEDIAASHNSQSDNSSGTSRHEKPAQIFKCNVCSSVFPTRNKMFDHIKKEGHAIRLDAPPQETTKRDRKNKRKGKR